MNNDRSPAWKMEKVVTINSEFSLCGLIVVCACVRVRACVRACVRAGGDRKRFDPS